MTEAVIVAPMRTAIGKFNGSLVGTPAVALGAATIKAAMERGKARADQIDAVVMGNVIQAGNRMNPARQATLYAGLPNETPAVTVNRVCGSGAEAIAQAANQIWLGHGRAIIAGGMENMDRAPYLVPGARSGLRMGDSVLEDSMLLDGLHDAFSGQHSGWHTEDVAREHGISRIQQDQWALRSQSRFTDAQAQGKFVEEIVPVELASKKGVVKFSVDETPRPDTTLEGLTKLRPVFREDGTITAGNAPGLNAAASAMIIADRAFAEASGMEPSARVVAHAVSAIRPEHFALAPIEAIRLVLERAQWSLADVDRFEINEAYAAVPLLVSKALRLPHDIVNVEGGAIAHGHPIGATGAILVTRLVHALHRDDLRRGIISLCIGGGQGIAIAIDLLS